MGNYDENSHPVELSDFEMVIREHSLQDMGYLLYQEFIVNIIRPESGLEGEEDDGNWVKDLRERRYHSGRVRGNVSSGVVEVVKQVLYMEVNFLLEKRKSLEERGEMAASVMRHVFNDIS